MSAPDDPEPEITDAQVEAIREALAQPGVREALDRLPPELRRAVDLAREALGNDDARAALGAVAGRTRDGVAPPTADVVRLMLASFLGEAVGGLRDAGRPAEVGAKAAAAVRDLARLAREDGPTVDDEVSPELVAAFERVVERLESLDLDGTLVPVLGEAASIQADLRALPGRISRLRGDPAEVTRHVAALESRARVLEQRATAMAGSDLVDALRAAVGDLSAAVDLLEHRSPALILAQGALAAQAGDVEAAREAFHDALGAAEVYDAVGPAQLAAQLLQLHAVEHDALGEAAALAERVALVAERAGDARQSILSRYEQGLLEARAGQHAKGQDRIRAVLERARALKQSDLVLRGVVLIGKLHEASGQQDVARGLYEGVVNRDWQPGLSSELSQAAMGLLRCLDPGAVTDPRRIRALPLVRRGARDAGDALTFAQASVLLAETQEALGDRRAALRALLEGREALEVSPYGDPTLIDPALRVFETSWGAEEYAALTAEVRPPSA